MKKLAKKDKKTAGARLREARGELGLSLEALGAKVHLSLAFMSDVERGKRIMPFKYWGLILKALPSLDASTMALAFLSSGSLKIDARKWRAADQKTLAEILARYATSGADGASKEAA